MKFNDELQAYVDNDLQLSSRDIARALQFRREMPQKEQWFKEKKCVSCGHLPQSSDFSGDFSRNYFRIVRICQDCQNRMF